MLKVVDHSQSDDLIASVRGYINEGTLLISKLMVHPACQYQGMGSVLLDTIENWCPHRRYE